jgi:1-acyl-sn-glycerol-3-phosphate acyltransferase
VTGSVPDAWRNGPLLLAANHIGDFDPFVVAAALARAGVTPRFMVTGGILRTPIAGPLFERCGAIRVDRCSTPTAGGSSAPSRAPSAGDRRSRSTSARR